MELSTASVYARRLMDEHGLEAWGLEFDNGKSRMGACHQNKRTGLKKITLSRHYVRLNGWDVMEAVMLHEVAHALVGPGKGHGWEWKAQARALGVKPTACAAAGSVESPPARWTGVCTVCDKVVGRRHRLGAQMRRGNQYHRTCGSSSRVEWKENA